MMLRFCASQFQSPLSGFSRAFSSNPSDVLTFKTSKCDTHLISAPPDTVHVEGKQLIDFFETMFKIRRMEVLSDKMYKAKKIRGFLHLYNGQEAICVGIEAGIRKQDHLITAYRDHGYALTRGDTPRRIIAELLGKQTGSSKGKGGSMHMYSLQNHFYGGNGIVGAQVPIGAGVAFAAKYKGTDEVCVALYGDGAANQGQIFETYNMSKLWNLPIVFVCENNKYGMGTSANRASASTEFYKRGDFVPGIRVDGMDVLSVMTATKHAADHAKKNGPVILEMVTYRYVGHSMSDPGKYRSREEVDTVKQNSDPIDQVRNKILEAGLLTADQLKVLEKKINKDIEDAAAQAEADPSPDVEKDLYKDVYVEDTYVRGPELTLGHFPN